MSTGTQQVVFGLVMVVVAVVAFAIASHRGGGRR